MTTLEQNSKNNDSLINQGSKKEENSSIIKYKNENNTLRSNSKYKKLVLPQIQKERNSYINKKMESDKLITTYKNNLLKATELLKNNPKGVIIGGALVIKYDNAAYLFTEGIDESFNYLNCNYLIKWQLITDYNNQGLKYVNFNGII